MDEKKITIRVTPEIHKQLKILATEKDTSINAIATELLKVYTGKHVPIEVKKKTKKQ